MHLPLRAPLCLALVIGCAGDQTPDFTGRSAQAISVAVEALDFGDVGERCAARLEIPIENVGGARLTVGSVELTADGDYAIGGALPAIVDAGEALALAIIFTPQSADADGEAAVTIASDDPDQPSIRVELTAAAVDNVERGQVSVAWAAPEAQQVDMLWVIDGAQSVEPTVEAMVEAAGAFYSPLRSAGVDLRVGVVSTDAGSGVLLGEHVDVGSDDDLASALDLALSAPGTTQPSGLAAARAALSEPLASGENAGFLRDDARLATIAVSNRDDASDETADLSVGAFVAWYAGLRDDPGGVTFSALAGEADDDCEGDLGSAWAAPRYVEAIERIGGAHERYCSRDLEGALAAMADAAVRPDACFDLPATPVGGEDGIYEVALDGEVLGSSEWRWHPEFDCVELSDGWLAAEGATLEVDYDYHDCG